MRHQYYIAARGYECFTPYNTLGEARKVMREFVASDMKICKARHGCAYKNKGNDDSYSVLIGNNSQAYNIYSAYSIVKA